MARFSGNVGYVGETVEDPIGSGVYKEVMVEFPYRGDVNRNTRRLESGDKVNNDLTVSNSISIVADAYANEHFYAIRYIQWAGARWTVTNVEVQRPRLLLELGGLWNGPTA